MSINASENAAGGSDYRRSAQRSTSSRSEEVSGDDSGESHTDYSDSSGGEDAQAGGEHGPTRLVRMGSARPAGRRGANADDSRQDAGSSREDTSYAKGGARGGQDPKRSLVWRGSEEEGRKAGPGMVAGVLKSLLKSSMQASFQGRQSAPSVESAGAGVEPATFEDVMSRKTKANLAWYFRPAVHRVALSIVLVRCPTECCSTERSSLCRDVVSCARERCPSQQCAFFCFAL